MSPRDDPFVQAAVNTLTDWASRIPAARAVESVGRSIDPGLYAWWVDDAGAGELSRGLGNTVKPGLIYAGQTGAGASSAMLGGRIGRSHLRGNIRGSTFRWTLAAALRSSLDLRPIGWRQMDPASEQSLSRWMLDHLAVLIHAVPDRTTLRHLERAVLARLDPPLNLEGMGPTPLRSRLSAMRRDMAPRRPPTDAARTRRVPAARVARPRSAQAAQSVVPGRIDARSLLSSLVRKTIPTMTGRPNDVLAITGDVVIVGTTRSPGGQSVPIDMVQAALDRLVRDGQIEISVESVGHRSAFVGAVLATLPGAIVSTHPRMITLRRAGDHR